MTRVRTLLASISALAALVLSLMVGSPAPLAAQVTVTSTTLSAAAAVDTTSATSTISVTSATGFAAGRIVFVDREAMQVLPSYVSGTTIPVQRGVQGTARAAHASGSTVYVGLPNYFSQVVPTGTCTATAEVALPRIVLPAGLVYQCVNSIWQRIGADVGQVQASFVQGATAADALDTIFFIADREYVVTAISAVWGTAESTGSMDIMVEKLTGTTACASGTDLLSAAIAGTGTANTVNNGALVTTASAHVLAVGNRLCVDLSATPNEVVNMVVTVTLVPR
jgi:hypothetical protein